MTDTTPNPGSRQPRRRINPDKAPFDQLHLLKATGRGGPINVTRGEFDLDELTDEQRTDVTTQPDDEFVVFTNAMGHHNIARRGQLIDPDLDVSRMGNLPLIDDLDALLGRRVVGGLEEKVKELREHIKLCTMLADYYQTLIDDGWKDNLDPNTRAWGNLVDTNPEGESFAPGPRKR